MDVGPPAGTWETYNGYTLKDSLFPTAINCY